MELCGGGMLDPFRVRGLCLCDIRGYFARAQNPRLLMCEAFGLRPCDAPEIPDEPFIFPAQSYPACMDERLAARDNRRILKEPQCPIPCQSRPPLPRALPSPRLDVHRSCFASSASSS